MARLKKFTKAEIKRANEPFIAKVSSVPASYDRSKLYVNQERFNDPTTLVEAYFLFYFGGRWEYNLKSTNQIIKNSSDAIINNSPSTVEVGYEDYLCTNVNTGAYAAETYVKRTNGELRTQCQEGKSKSFDEFVVFVNTYLDVHYLDIYSFYKNINIKLNLLSLDGRPSIASCTDTWNIVIGARNYKSYLGSCSTIQRINGTPISRQIGITSRKSSFEKEDFLPKVEKYFKKQIAADKAKAEFSKVTYSTAGLQSVFSWAQLEEQLISRRQNNKEIVVDYLDVLRKVIKL